jgi:hypothetical protein
MAKASEQDMAVVGTLAGILNDIDSGYFPRLPDLAAESDENDPDFFDHDDHEHLRALYDRLKVCLDSAPGGTNRVVLGFHTLMHNDLVDPGKDYLDFHPKIKAALGIEEDADEEGTPF